MNYHRSSLSVASTFARDLQLIARRLYVSAPTLPQSDRQFLKDVARDERRYGFISLQRLISCSRQSVKPEDREALPELIRGEILSGVPLEFNIAMAFDAETFAQGEADNAQRLYERRLCAASRDVAIEKLTVHHAALRASLDAVLANRI